VFKRFFQITLLAATTFSLVGAATPAKRVDKIGHKLMCTCGCAEILLECNHVGCPNSTGEIAELHSQVDAGATDTEVFQAFASKYGAIVLAAPIRGGFDDVAWIMPFAVLILGILGVIVLLKLWKRRHIALGPTIPDADDPAANALRDRIRSETHYGE
jgi:cytochrome c-type biogenesis protein CcmH/NrfF